VHAADFVAQFANMAAFRKRAAKKEVDLDEMAASGPAGAYEALQLYRSRAIRQRTKDDTMGAIKTTAVGAKCLLQKGYETAGSELATLFLDLVGEHNYELTDELRALVYEIDDAYPKTSSARVEFLKGALKWTITCGRKELGDAELQTRLAECLWEMKEKTAAYHFAAGEAPIVLCDKIMTTYPDQNQQDKRDQSLILGVTNFLALENLRDANELWFAFKKACKGKGFPLNSKLIQFCDYLLQTCRRDAAPLFKQLVNAYASDLDFDDTVPTLLMGPIAVRLFNIKPKINPMMSMLQSMIS
jgi:hypothetical protein